MTRRGLRWMAPAVPMVLLASASASASGEHIHTQFFAEALSLSLIGGVRGVLATTVYAGTRDWHVAVSRVAWAGGLGAALVVGAVAGLLPALRAVHPPIEAVRTL